MLYVTSVVQVKQKKVWKPFPGTLQIVGVVMSVESTGSLIYRDTAILPSSKYQVILGCRTFSEYPVKLKSPCGNFYWYYHMNR